MTISGALVATLVEEFRDVSSVFELRTFPNPLFLSHVSARYLYLHGR